MIAVSWLIAAGGLVAVAQRAREPAFRHESHTRLFPESCTACHVGAIDPAQSFWPAPASCASCHDGEVQPIVVWTPRTESPPSNVRFVHDRHAAVTADSVRCAQCHVQGDPKGEVHVSRAVQCVSCHKPGREHLEVGDLECATCHYPLAEVKRLTSSDVASFPVPLSHQCRGSV